MATEGRPLLSRRYRPGVGEKKGKPTRPESKRLGNSDLAEGGGKGQLCCGITILMNLGGRKRIVS